MSVGFPFGDFIAFADIAIKIVSALAAKNVALRGNPDLVTDLHGMQQIFLQVAKEHLGQAATNAFGHVTAIFQAIRSGSNYTLKRGWWKLGWTLFKPGEIKMLRETLQIRRTSINVLVSFACLSISEYGKCMEDHCIIRLYGRVTFEPVRWL